MTSRRPPRAPIAAATAGALVTFALAACSSPAGSGSGGSSAPSSAQVAAFGTAPHPTGEVTLQPDVVVVGGGAAAVRSESADGLTWTIEAQAPHAADLSVGSVLFLTDRVAGRVVRLQPRGSELAVTLAPVELGDIVKDGTLTADQPLDLSRATFHQYAGAGGLVGPASGTTDGAGTASPSVALPGSLRVVPALAPAPASVVPTPALSQAQVKVGRFVFTDRWKPPTGPPSSFDVGVDYQEPGGLKLGARVTFRFASPGVETSLRFRDGKPTDGSYVRFTGLEAIAMQVDSGSVGGLSSNVSDRFEIPLETCTEMVVYGVPMVACLKLQGILQTAFSARNSTLSTTGEVSFHGPLAVGWSAGQPHLTVPSVAVTKHPEKALDGVSVGVDGLVLAIQLKAQIGIGMEVARIGPYVAWNLSYGLTDGSSVGIVHCTRATVTAVVTGGLNTTLAPPKVRWLTSLLGPAASKLIDKIQVDRAFLAKQLINETDYEPKVAVCRASS